MVECVGGLIRFLFESYRTISTFRLNGRLRRQSSHQGNGPPWWDSSHTALWPRSGSPSPRFDETEQALQGRSMSASRQVSRRQSWRHPSACGIIRTPPSPCARDLPQRFPSMSRRRAFGFSAAPFVLDRALPPLGRDRCGRTAFPPKRAAMGRGQRPSAYRS